jgi:hypothetical protein
VSDYRKPGEQRASDRQDARIRKVLDQAVHDGASCKAAMMLGESPDVVEQWVNKIWNGLRDGLAGESEHPELRAEDTLAAIIGLLEERMSAEAQALIDPVEDLL